MAQMVHYMTDIYTDISVHIYMYRYHLYINDIFVYNDKITKVV